MVAVSLGGHGPGQSSTSRRSGCPASAGTPPGPDRHRRPCHGHTARPRAAAGRTPEPSRCRASARARVGGVSVQTGSARRSSSTSGSGSWMDPTSSGLLYTTPRFGRYPLSRIPSYSSSGAGSSSVSSPSTLSQLRQDLLGDPLCCSLVVGGVGPRQSPRTARGVHRSSCRLSRRMADSSQVGPSRHRAHVRAPTEARRSKPVHRRRVHPHESPRVVWCCVLACVRVGVPICPPAKRVHPHTAGLRVAR